MDGLMIDSEPLWTSAQKEVLQQCGVKMAEGPNDTTGLRVDMVVNIWYQRQPWVGKSREEVCQNIIDLVSDKVMRTKPIMPGLYETIELLHSKGLKLAVASSSPMPLIKRVINSLDLENKFEVLSSAGDLPYAKPHPEVYLTAANQLGIDPTECIALEDSFSGLLAAKSARMRAIVVPDVKNYDREHWVIADGKSRCLFDSTELISRYL